MTIDSKWLAAFAVLLFVGLLTNTSHAQNVTANEVRVSSFPDITTLVTVTDNQGDPVPGLTENDFQITEDGTFQNITNVVELGTTGASNISSSLVIDRSGSMGGGKLSDAQQAANSFIDRLSSGDRASVISFNDGSRLDQGFTSDKNALKSAVNSLSSGGGTAVWDAIADGINEVELEANRRAVLALTDGQDGSSSISPQDVITRANNAGIPVYTIALGSSPQTAELQDIASQTGGQFFQAPSASDLDQIYQAISNQLGNRYEITYSTSNTALDGSIRSVGITANYGGGQQSTTTSYTAPNQASNWQANFQSPPTPGSTVSVNIFIESILDLFRATLTLEYSSGDLNFDSSQIGTLLGSNPESRISVDQSNGTIDIGLRRSSGSSGGSMSGELLQLTFDVSQSATNPLVGISNVDARDSDGNPIAVSAPGGLVTVEGTAQYARSAATYDNTVVSAFDSDGDVFQRSMTDGNGNYTMRVRENSFYELRVTDVPGMPTGVNSGDAFDTLLYYLSGTGLSSFQQGVADVDGNGDVGISDAFAIYNNWLGRQNSAFPVGTVYSQTQAVATYGSQDQLTRDFSFAAAGDANLDGGFTGGGTPVTSKSLTVTEAENALNETVRSVEPGGTFEIPVRATKSADLGAYQLSFNYPSDVANFEGVSSSGKDVQSRRSKGSVRLGWFDREGGNSPISVQSGDPIMTLTFTAKEGISSEEFRLRNVDGALTGTQGQALTEVGVSIPVVETAPESFALHKNAPNPFSGRTSIQLDMPESGHVTVSVFNSLGQEVKTVQRQMGAGQGQSIELDGSAFGSGVYFYRVKAETGSGTFRTTGRMTVVK